MAPETARQNNVHAMTPSQLSSWFVSFSVCRRNRAHHERDARICCEPSSGSLLEKRSACPRQRSALISRIVRTSLRSWALNAGILQLMHVNPAVFLGVAQRRGLLPAMPRWY